MHNTFTAVFNSSVFTVLCNGKCVATVDIENRTKCVYDQELYEEAAETLFDVFTIIRLRISH